MSHEMLIPVVREALRAIVSDQESCRLLGVALMHAQKAQETITDPETLPIEAKHDTDGKIYYETEESVHFMVEVPIEQGERVAKAMNRFAKAVLRKKTKC